jgi:hypothetical protein
MSIINHKINPLDEQCRHRHYLGLPTATVIAWGGIVNQVDAFDYSFHATVTQSIEGLSLRPITMQACASLDRRQWLPRIGQRVYMCGALSAIRGSCPQVVLDDLIILTP